MRAIVLDHFGGLDSLVIKEIPEPEPEAGKVVFRSRHLESIMPRCTCAAEFVPMRDRACICRSGLRKRIIPTDATVYFREGK
jgi:hypothetical protein